MRLTLRSLAALLGYPSAELKEHARELREALAAERALSRASLARLRPLLDALERDELLDLQADYSELFDRSRTLSLHLFEHVHGDSRERGQAMIDLGEQYAAGGFFLEGSELPDFVPVFLEFASCLPPVEAGEMLAQPAHVFAALAERLDKREAAYAGIFHALVELAGAKPDAEALAEIEANTGTEDEQWEEAPVTFGGHADAHEMGGPTGVVAKIRAARRAVSAAFKA